MKVLIIGSGGREHALAWKVADSSRVEKVFVAPGNAGTAYEKKCENVALPADSIDALLSFASSQAVDLTIVGPEAPLVEGIVDRFQAAGLPCFGPTAAAAQLEGSKAFAKDFMAHHGIPTADYESFSGISEALEYVRQQGAPIVVKADGLAAGKGVVVATTIEQAEEAVHRFLGNSTASGSDQRVVIEEFVEGEEASFIVLADGMHALPLASSQDHKTIGDGDTGPNTGGMGAYSPAPVVDQQVHDKVMNEVILPTIRGMAMEGHPLTGFLYAGLMVLPDGNIKVLEFNVRFGDPETQPILYRLYSDLPTLCEAALDQKLNEYTTQWNDKFALGVVLAAKGYPGDYQTGMRISGLNDVVVDDIKVFHAGTRIQNNHVFSTGGRVLCVVALGDDVKNAQQRAYAACDQIQFEGKVCRRDIGYRAIARDQA